MPDERRQRKDAQRNRELLVQAGREVFAERGLEASLDDVARHAGVGVGTAYRHFANKHDLARAIFEVKIETFMAIVDESLAMPDPWAGVVHFLESAAAAQSNDRGLRAALIGVHLNDEMDRMHERMGEAIAQLVTRAKDAGVMRADADVTDIGMIVLMVCTVADLAGDIAPDLWQRYLPILLDGLRPGRTLAVPPMDEADMRKAMTVQLQRQARIVEKS